MTGQDRRRVEDVLRQREHRIAALGKILDYDAYPRSRTLDCDRARPRKRGGDFVTRRSRGGTRDLRDSRGQAVDVLQHRAGCFERLE